MEDRIIKWLLGELSPEEAVLIKEEIEADPELKNLAEEYHDLLKGLEEAPVHKPDSSSKLRFQQWLKIQENQGDRKFKTVRLPVWIKYGIAASILLATGLYIGKQISTPGKETLRVVYSDSKDELMHLIKTETTSQRIKGINRSYELPDLDPDVKGALLNVLNDDESANVRLAAVEALGYFSHQEEIKTLLIDQLKVQEDPIVQIAIINALVDLGDQDATHTFEEMLNGKELPKSVQDELAHGMIKIL
jgi:hypothetical protein